MRRSIVLPTSLILCMSLLARQASLTQSARVAPREPQQTRQQQQQQYSQQQQQQQQQQQPSRQVTKSPYLDSDESHETQMRVTNQQQRRQQSNLRLGSNQATQDNTTQGDQQDREQRQQQQQRQQQRERPQADWSRPDGAGPSAARTPIRVDKRSWSPRASRTQESSKEDEAVSLLLEEVASLDIDTANGDNSGQQSRPDDKALQSASGASAGSLNSGGRARSVSSFLVGGTGSPNSRSTVGSQSVVNGSRTGANMPPFRVGTMGAEFPKRTNNRHLPCFFNAIACF